MFPFVQRNDTTAAADIRRNQICVRNSEMSTAAPVDIDVLRGEIQKTYTGVAKHQEKDFVFPTGRRWAEDLGYPRAELARVPGLTPEAAPAPGRGS